MLTRCPNCQTTFRIREEQLKIADGLARCYRCEQVFNALENLSTTPEPSPSSQEAASDPQKKEDTTRAAPSTQIESVIEDIQKDIDAPLAQNADTATAVDPDSAPISVEELLATPKAKWRLFRALFWLLACTTLLAAATLQLAWFERGRVIRHPQGRMLLEKICHYAQCQVPELRDLTLIKIIQRQIASHPHKRNALLVQLTMKNRAIFSQPYPILELSLSSVNETLIARRSFSPAEYLNPATGHNQLMLPGSSQQIQIEIEDPGEDVTGFEFNFF